MTVTLDRPQQPVTSEAISIIASEWREFVDDRSRVEPLELMYPYLSRRLGQVGMNSFIFTAFDNDTGAFKWRGAFRAVYESLQDGATAISAGSAGNHGSGVAAAGAYFDVPVFVYVPEGTPTPKLSIMRGYGAHVIEGGKTVEDALNAAQGHPGASFVHAYNNPAVMRGQGSMVDEVLRDMPQVETIGFTAGGLGMGGGIANRLRDLGREDIKLVAVVGEGATSLESSLESGNVLPSERITREYGGAAVRSVGELPFRACQSYPNFEVTSMSRAEVEDVVAELMQQNHDLDRNTVTNLEPTSQLAVAAFLRANPDWGKTVVIGSGANEPADTILGRHKLQRRRLYI